MSTSERHGIRAPSKSFHICRNLQQIIKVNLYVFNSLDIETYHLTDEQRLGLDPILHLGTGIPFYILIDKDGVIVDFGEHLRPSIPETRDIIDRYVLIFEN